MEIVVPAAGLSTRYPGHKPKFMLYDYTGMSMLKRALLPYIGKYKITVGVLEEHDKLFDIKSFIKHEFDSSVNLIILPNRTAGPASTVQQLLLKSKIPNWESIFIKDCDSFFDIDLNKFTSNFVCIKKISSLDKNLSAKSFVIQNNEGIILNIFEKEIVSDTYCVGGYGFENPGVFLKAYDDLKNLKKDKSEIFVSHVIKACSTQRNCTFFSAHVENYHDVGTIDEWLIYNNKPVIFCDIDGTLIHSQQRYGPNSYSVDPIPLTNNIEAVLQKYKNGSQIIFTTARPESVRDITKEMLEKLGFDNFQLLMNLNNSSRILINDYNESNPYPRATSINILRNSDTLKDFL